MRGNGFQFYEEGGTIMKRRQKLPQENKAGALAVQSNRPKDDESRSGAQDNTLGDLEPRAEIKGGSLGIYQATDVTLKRGSGG